MTENTRKILLSIFLSLLIVSLMSFSLTWARYSEEMPSGGDYSGDLEYVVSDQIEISSAEDFFTAIENGYTNIKISDETDNPLIVTGGVSDVNSDLTIDLNGHELQRNNREPMLNITDGVRLTVIDSSEEQSGCFYNPVGDVLQISGGTLTVTGGIFESGPRNGKSLSESQGDAFYKSEYAAYNGSLWTTDSGASINENNSVKYYAKSGDSYSQEPESKSMPILIPNVTTKTIDGEYRYSVNGNMYFGSQSSFPNGIDSDTYLYFTIDEEGVENNRIAATNGSADFYYTYYMVRSGDGNNVSYSYKGTSSSEGAALVTVYGYTKVKSLSDDNGGIGYAAIRMNSGNLYVRGGSYSSYFGTESTSCVYASGGYMAVEEGTFEAQSEAVCVNVDYGSLKGKSEDDRLKVDNGSFYSEKGDTIRVQNGVMVVTGGDFNKSAPVDSGNNAGDNNAIISISGGELTVEGEQRVRFSLKGSYMYGIESLNSDSGDSGTVTVTNADFNFNQGGGSSYTTNYAIYSAAGEVNVKGCVFTLPGKESRGISIESGTVNVDGAGGTENFGANALDTDEYSYFYLDQAVGCYGVFAQSRDGAKATINMAAAQIFVGQLKGAELGDPAALKVNGAGIYVDSISDSQLNLGNTLVIATGNSVSGIYVNGGNIRQDQGKKLVVITGAQVVQYIAGETHFQDIDSYNFETDLVQENRIGADGIKYTYGVYSNSGEIFLENLYTAVYGDYAAGLLTTGGDITVSGVSAIRVIGTDKDNLSSSGISTENGKIVLKSGGNIYVEYGLGLTARKGNISFEGSSSEELQNEWSLKTPHSTAIYVNEGNIGFGTEENDRIRVGIDSAIHESLTWVTPPGDSGGGIVSNPNQSDGIYVQGGSLSAYGELNVSHKGLDNDSGQVSGGSDELYRTFITKSFAVRIESSKEQNADVTIVKGTITNSRGGGIYVSGTAESKVSLGNEGDNSESVSVNTTGTEIYNQKDRNGKYSYSKYQYDAAAFFDASPDLRDNWKYLMSKSGGPAIAVNGGSLTVYNGTYTAAQGDGVRVTGGNSVIYGGTFTGADVYGAKGADPSSSPLAGPGASYSFKMYGGETKIYGGTFGNNSASGSGAFIMGTSLTDKGIAKIYGGSFNVGGQAGFSVYNYADLTFDPEAKKNPGDSGLGKGGNISVSGLAAGIAVEDMAENPAEITIHGGSFFSASQGSGDGSGIWYGNNKAKLTITGGEFTGSLVSGLYIYKDPNTNEGGSVWLSGGTYIAGKNAAAIGCQSDNIRYSDILAPSAVATAFYENIWGNEETEQYYNTNNTKINKKWGALGAGTYSKKVVIGTQG